MTRDNHVLLSPAVPNLSTFRTGLQSKILVFALTLSIHFSIVVHVQINCKLYNESKFNVLKPVKKSIHENKHNKG